MPSFALAAALAAALQAPVTSVTVFSDRARVVRTAHVAVQGQEMLEMPLLQDATDPSTIQIDARGAQVVRVDIQRVDEQDFPRDEARELLAAIEKLDDGIARVTGEQSARKRQLDLLRGVSPTVKLDDPLKPAPKLNAESWAAAFNFVGQASQKLQEQMRAEREKLIDLNRERQRLAIRAGQIGGARRRTGHRVRPTVSGAGDATLTMTYMVANARWLPSYDIQFLPARGEAQISFSGQVSQESGEDWAETLLTLSTAVPARSTVLPRLLSWKIGERERFIPSPARPEPSPIPPLPPVPPLPGRAEADEPLRQRLLAFAGRAPDQAGAEMQGEDAAGGGGEESAELSVGGTLGAYGAGRGGAGVRAQPPMKLSERKRAARRMPKPAAAPPPPMAEALAAPEPMSKMEAKITSAPARAAAPVSQVGLAPPPAYVPPSFDASLPASLAGGYDLAFASLNKESIKTGSGARRVPLFSERWPVSAERVVYPALAPEAAFLVAEIKNPSQRVLPGGGAELSVGADPAGSARLSLVAPGETLTLPLGLDRAIKPIRNVNIVTEEKGLFSKDDLTTYVVTIELANPYRQAVPIKVIDQVPLAGTKDVEIKLEKAEPAPAKSDKDTGQLEWKLELPASGKAQVRFTYSLRRPKGYRLYQ